MEPINYQIDVASPFQAALSGYQGGAAVRNDQQDNAYKQQERAIALQQQQQQQQVISSLLANPNPTANDYSNATMMIPGLKDHFKQAWDIRNQQQQQEDLAHTSQVLAALTQGRGDIASSIVRQKADAYRNSGDAASAKQLEQKADIIDGAPRLARTMYGMQLSSMPGGDKAAEGISKLGANDRADQVQPAAVRSANADATTKEGTAQYALVQAGANARLTTAQADKTGAEAAVAPQMAQAELAMKGLQGQNIRGEIADRVKRFGLDTDKFQSELKVKLLELQNKLGELPEPVAKEVNAAATDAIASQNSAAKMTDLASQIDKAASAMPSGVRAKSGELWKKTFGSQNDLTRIRAEYNRIVTPAAMAAYKTVASGSTSDKDIETAMTGVPGDTADPAMMSSFLRGAAKLQAYNSVLKNAESEWQGAVHNLGKARQDISIDGVKVPAGTTFKQFSDQYVQSKAAKLQAATTVQTRGYMLFAQPDAPAPGGLGSGTYGAQ